MTSRVNDMPPPWPNQALAQAREASQVPAKKQDETPKSGPVDEVAITAAKPPASEQPSNVEAKPNVHEEKSSAAEAVDGHVNIVA
mgnify:FL=1|jgi:hypothetical protein